MADVYVYRLEKNYESILRDLEPRQVLNYLYQEDVIDGDVRDEVRAGRTRKRQAETLLDSIVRRGPDAIQQLIVGLQNSSQKHLAEILKKPMIGESGISRAMSQPVIDCDKPYPMNRDPRGLAVIINNYTFEEHTELEIRNGSEQDVIKMTELFRSLKFEVIPKSNMTASEMRMLVRKYYQHDHTKYDCFVIFFMSHGTERGICGTDGQVINMQEDIISKFNSKGCPTLATKPKLFFVQACRGSVADIGVDVLESPADSTRQQPSSEANLPQPVDPRRRSIGDKFPTMISSDTDIFIGYASSPTRAAHRNTVNGGWFVSKLYEVMMEYADKEDLLSMMTKVNAHVNTFQRSSPSENNETYMQAPELHSRLRMKLFFNPNSVSL